MVIRSFWTFPKDFAQKIKYFRLIENFIQLYNSMWNVLEFDN